jgi:hypothetical protein
MNSPTPVTRFRPGVAALSFALCTAAACGGEEPTLGSSSPATSRQTDSARDSTWQPIKSVYFHNWNVHDWYLPWRIGRDFGRYPTLYRGGGWMARVTPFGQYGNGLQVKYPAGKVGWDESGVSFIVPLPDENEYLLTYKVYFEPRFQWKNGGKLPGLAGGTATAGGYEPKGNGYTARFMWRKGGELELYLYHMDMPGRYGHRFSIKRNVLKTGVWYRLELRLKVNTNNRHNGEVTGTIRTNGGRLLGSRTVRRLRWREGKKAPVNRLYFTTFYGGNRPHSDSPDYITRARFDTFKVLRRRKH